MLRAKHQIAQGDHYGATRSLTILREESYSISNMSNSNNNSSINNSNMSNNNNHNPPQQQPVLPEVLRSKLEQWLLATIDTLLMQVTPPLVCSLLS